MAAVRLCVVLLMGISLQCAAAPFAVQVGEARIGLDAPSGFADTQFTGSPRLQEFGESLTSASNRILLFALSDADLRRFMVGDQIELRRYMIAVTPRSMERDRVGEPAFKQFTGGRFLPGPWHAAGREGPGEIPRFAARPALSACLQRYARTRT